MTNYTNHRDLGLSKILENEGDTYIDIVCRGASRLTVTYRWQYRARDKLKGA